MRAWPLASHFSNVLQNPPIAFRDAELKALDIEKDTNGQPRPRSGAFANVYKGTFPKTGEPICIRVFTSGNSERRDRYRAISDYLAARNLDCLVKFTYRDDGIRSAGDGKFYPLVTMEWVRGEQLFEWTQARCQSNDCGALGKIAEAWVAMIKDLRAAQIAHGDLQHGNIMVTDKAQLKLVDYDCMCVPALAGLKNLEIGVDPYQHRERDETTLLSANLDNFSSLMIFIALRALAADPPLWRAHVTSHNYDKLLFKREDLDDPDRSALIHALRRSPDPEVRRLTEELLNASNSSIDRVLPLDEFLFSFGSVETLLTQRDFDAALELLARNRKDINDAPPALRGRLTEARERIALRLELEKAVERGDEVAMQRCYRPQLLDDYPKAAPAVKAAKEAQRVIPVLARLQATSQAQKWREFVGAWDQNQALLAARKSAAAYLPLVKTWRERNEASGLVLKLLQDPSCDPQEVAAAWDRLAGMGGHPECQPHEQRLQQLVQRQQAWNAFQRGGGSLDEDADRHANNAWNERLFAGWDIAERERPRVEAARARLALLKEFGAVADKPVSRSDDQRLMEIAARLPADYGFRRRSALDLAQQRVKACTALDRAFVEPMSDIGLAMARKLLDASGGLSLMSAAQAERVALAMKRIPPLKLLKPIPRNYSPESAKEWDAKLLEAWNNDLLGDCQDARPWKPAWKLAKARQRVLTALEKAIANGEKIQAVELAADPCLNGVPLPQEWNLALKVASGEVAAVRALVAVLEGDEPRRLLPVFDVRTIVKNASILAPYRQKLLEWMATDVLPASKLGLGPPVGRPALSKTSAGDALWICWNWPQPRFSEVCMLTVTRQRPKPGDDLMALSAFQRLRVDRRSFEDGGGGRSLHAQSEWLGCYVTVWATIDLGFQESTSEPVVLGRLESVADGPRKKSSRLFW